MNPKWLKLAADMMRAYSDALGSNGCNDWDFPADWTEAEKAEFCLAEEVWNGSPQDFDPDNLVLPDFAVAGFLAAQLKTLAELGAKGAG